MKICRLEAFLRLRSGQALRLRSGRAKESQPETVTYLELEQGKNMYRVMKSSFGFDETPVSVDTKDEAAIGPEDLWLFTDPTARAIYSQQGRLDQLKQDIQTYVRREPQWDPDEVEFKRELQRLLKAGLIVPEPAFGHLSPHPTIYQAIEEGAIEISGERYAFDIGDQIVFEPWLERITRPGLVGPLRVGWLDFTTKLCLFREALPQLKELGEKELASLHETLYYYSVHKV
ncbi:MAG: hypothetical protein P8Y03_19815 [Anaerolineales bacterium]